MIPSPCQINFFTNDRLDYTIMLQGNWCEACHVTPTTSRHMTMCSVDKQGRGYAPEEQSAQNDTSQTRNISDLSQSHTGTRYRYCGGTATLTLINV